jgi:hypothetical protein
VALHAVWRDPVRDVSDSSGSPRSGRLLLAILATSFLLRVLLATSGGQNFWPDEVRYERSREAAAAIFRGDWDVARRALGHGDHLLFGVLGLAPAALERVTHRDSKIPAVFFGLFSVGSLLLLHGWTRRLGEDERTALIAAFLFSLTATNLYYSRHLLPYDAAMTFGLWSLHAGFRNPPRLFDSILCGLLSCCAFLTYNGYWLLAGFALLAHAMREPRAPASCARRALAAGSAFVLPIAAILGLDAARGGHLFRRWLAFSQAVTQGRYSEGWRLPFAYFWHAEHLLTVLWAVAFLHSAWHLARGDRGEAIVLGVTAIAVIYGGLVATSVVFERMVVYGRTSRQLAPFASLLAAILLARMWRASPAHRRAAIAVLAAALAQAAFNFYQPLTQVFPPEFRALAAKVAARSPGQKMLLYAEHIYPTPRPAPLGAGAVLIARRHPLEYLPYQYEGYTPEERAALRAADIRMRLVRLLPASDHPAARRDRTADQR